VTPWTSCRHYFPCFPANQSWRLGLKVQVDSDADADVVSDGDDHGDGDGDEEELMSCRRC
jgi:hypothetical protein